MKRRHQRLAERRPRLFWLVALMLAPVGLLAILASLALQQDRRATEAEAEARSREIAVAVLGQLETFLQQVVPLPDANSFATRTNLDTFFIDSRNQLISPLPRQWPPQPEPLNPYSSNALSVAKQQQWRAAENAFAQQAWQTALELYLEFLEGRRTLGAEPNADFQTGIYDSRFRPLALLSQAAAFERLGKTNEAIAAAQDALNDFIIGGSGGNSSAGIPFSHLAAKRILDLAQNQVTNLPALWRQQPDRLVLVLSQNASPFGDEIRQRLQSFGSALVAEATHPVSLDQLFQPWDRAQRSRQRYQEAMTAWEQKQSRWPAAFWVEGEKPWLAVAQRLPARFTNDVSPSSEQIMFGAFPLEGLQNEIHIALQRLDQRGDFVVLTKLAGKTLDSEESISDAPARRSFDQTSSALSSSSELPITVVAALRDPARYFAAQRRRQLLFSGMVFAALLVAVLGTWATRRALQRQWALYDQQSQFVSSVSHELRAPIASVRLMAESLERGKVTEPVKQREYFRFILQECRRLGALVENVLDFARIDQGRKEYEFEPTDLRRLVEETVKLMEPNAAEKKVRLEMPAPQCEISNLKFEILADGRALQQALINLIDNAIKHSPTGEAITVGLELSQPGQIQSGVKSEARNPKSEMDKLPNAFETAPPIGLIEPSPATSTHFMPHPSSFIIAVADRGPGIPLEDHDRIFERFYRRGSELRRETQGVGIGLSIVKHIVEAHSGCVRVASEPGQGSRFLIELPLVHNQAAKPPGPPS